MPDPDVLVISRFPGWENLVGATGHCMLGITLAPVTGKLLSQMVINKKPDVDMYPLRANRFF